MEGQNIFSVLEIWKFRKKYFFLTTLPILIAIAIYAFRMSPVYESSSTILIEEQQIPPEFVRSTVTGFADQHIQLLNQQILSRPRLEEVIERFDLYKGMRQTAPKEQVIERMRRDISFKTISADVRDRRTGSNEMTIAFKISYRGGNPATVQRVAGTLASLYLEQNLKFREEKAQTTTLFLQSGLKELQERIDTLGQQITAFKEQNEGLLPEEQPFNRAQVERLETEIKQADNTIRNAESQKIYLESLVSKVQPGSKDQSGEQIPGARERLQLLKEQMPQLRARYSPEHPELQRLSREKAELEKMLREDGQSEAHRQQKLINLKAELAQKQGLYGEQHPEIRRLQTEIAQLSREADKTDPLSADLALADPAQVNLVTQVNQLNVEIAGLQRQKQNLQEKLTIYRQRLEQAPRAEHEYLGLQRDYQNAQAKYHDVMNKLLEARIGEGLEEHQKGEKFTLIEAAMLPEQPIKPNRPLILFAGLICSVVAGAAVMTAAEVMDHSVKSPEELSWLTETAPLGIITNIQTSYDLKRKKQRLRFILATICLGSVLGLLLFHFFVKDLGMVLGKIGLWSDKYIIR
ncbi:MAG: GNVR domain-containing protein [Desulfobacca sp.]|nr:GNVR domain-containing protein [Desulfobacca sp.]